MRKTIFCVILRKPSTFIHLLREELVLVLKHLKSYVHEEIQAVPFLPCALLPEFNISIVSLVYFVKDDHELLFFDLYITLQPCSSAIAIMLFIASLVCDGKAI